MDLSATRDNLDIFGFLAIGLGSVYYILNDSGLSSSSEWLLPLCLAESAFFLIVGFESYSVEAENSSEVYRWPVWPFHMRVYFFGFIGNFLMAIILFTFMGLGLIGWIAALPLLIASGALSFYLWKALDTVTLRRKPLR